MDRPVLHRKIDNEYGNSVRRWSTGRCSEVDAPTFKICTLIGHANNTIDYHPAASADERWEDRM